MKNMVCNDQCKAGRVIVQHGKNFNVTIFLDAINVIM